MTFQSLLSWSVAVLCWSSATVILAVEGQLPPALFLRVAQSSDASPTNLAARALDGNGATCSLTTNAPGSFWTAELGRPYALSRIEVVNRAAPDDVEMEGLALRLLNLDDQVVFQTSLSNPGPGATLGLDLPAGLVARSIWVGLPEGQTNGAGNYRVGLAEARAFGVLTMPYGPEPMPASTNLLQVWQSSEYPGYPAVNAVDGNTGNFTHTANSANSYWMADLGRVVPLDRIEIVNRLDCCNNRLANLVLRVFDGASNSVSSAVLTDVGLGGLYTHTLPPGTPCRWIRVGLENGQMNGGGNYYITMAEARAFSGTTNVLDLGASAPVPVTPNLASFKPSYMLRLSATQPGATNANDDNYSTAVLTTMTTVDGYWETDLGATYALYSVRSIAASGIAYRLTNAIVRLFDAAHESVYAQRITGVPDAFDTDLNGPVFARYVRVGLEDKQRTDPAGGIEFYIGFREVEVFGRPTNGLGIVSFTASTNQVEPGQEVTLSWNVAEVRRVEIHPAIGSVGALTAPDGLGHVTVAVTNSTEFILVASNAAGLFSAAVTVRVASNVPPVLLSELVAENKYSLKDGYGEASDWIELRNPRDTAVDLTGWGLSDDTLQPMKWVFPPTSLPPHATLIVFASGRESSLDPAGNLHAAFRLDKAGGTLLLSSPETNTVDLLGAYPELDTDLAYGRDLEGRWTFLEPTPHALNAAVSYLGWLKPLDWSHARGFHETGFTLTLTNRSPGSTILYSLDGSAPTLPYAEGLAITNTKAVRAQAVRAGYKPARIQTKTFLFLNDVVTSPLLNTAITQDPAYASRLKPGLLSLPSVSICVPDAPEYWEKEGSLEILWPDGSAPVQVNCGISRYGNAWTKYAKRSIRMKCRAQYGEANLSAPLFNGFDRTVLAKTSFDELDFRSGSQDMYERGFYMAGRFVEDSMLDMGSLNPHGRFVHVYLNGAYWGQYDCREQLVDHFLADYLGGTEQDYLVVRGNDNAGDDFVLGTPDPPDLTPWERVLSLRNSYHAVRPYLDVPHFLDFMLLWNYGNCESEYRACGSREAGSGFKFWIADADGFLRTGAMGLNRTVRNGPGNILSSLVAENHPDFKTLLADRIYKHFFNNGALTPARNEARLNARMLEVRDSLIVECARWNYRTPASWESAAAAIRTGLFPGRSTELVAMLRTAGLYPTFDPPTFTPYGGVVTAGFQPQLTSAAGTIYYTLDGSDPRLPGGEIAPGALVWAPGALTLTQDLTLTARVRNAQGQWSALAQPRFLLVAPRAPGARDLLITEIHYHPAGDADAEFIELYNAASSPLDLSGVALSNAVRYIFANGFLLPPHTFVVIAKDTAAFASRYQDPASLYYRPGLNLLGPWAGSLNNAGETLQLVASNGLEICSVGFKPNGAWPERADGQGSSLELRALPPASASAQEVRAFIADGANWTSSPRYHGSPGGFDPFVKTVRINELLSHSLLGEDWIELRNVTTQAVSLAHCTLTDTLALPDRYAFPPETLLQPGDFRVLSATQLGFAFGEMGESVSLLQWSGTNILWFLDTVDFPAAAPEEPFGTYTRRDGAVDFTELSAATPGADNAPPRVGPVVITEILFAPAPGEVEFLELTSLTNGPVPLFDPDYPTNVWTLAGIGNFAFPPGTVLAPNAMVIVCATNPESFRAQYGLPAELPIFGPFDGGLDRNGEALKLLRPGLPQTNGTVPYYRVDHVTYRTAGSWPPAIPGASLQKTAIAAYGNDPFNWTAATPTPGASFAPTEGPVIVQPPQDLRVGHTLTATFSVIATGAPPFGFQWRFDGTYLSGATNDTLVLTNLQLSQAGAYDVLVHGRGGWALSPVATLFVVKPPIITLQPLSQSNRLGSNVVFTVAATGNGPLRYQWQLNGIALPGATNTTLSLTNLTSDHGGAYTVLVTDDLGSLVSTVATLTVLVEPFILQQPLSQSVLAGGTVTLSVRVTNTATLPINYRWRRGSFTLTNLYLNSRSSFVTLTNVQTPNTNWNVFVANAARPVGFASVSALLTILADTNANGLPDTWEAAYGFGPANPATFAADPDGDGLANGQEYLAGTDPTNPASCLRVEVPSPTNGAVVRFSAVSNRTYSVLFTDALGAGPWTKLADVTAATTNHVETIPDPAWTTNRFYRVATPRQP